MNFYWKYYNKVTKYFSKHVIYCSTVHFIGGVGVGVIIARPFDMGHPVQIGVALLALATLGHLVPVIFKMK